MQCPVLATPIMDSMISVLFPTSENCRTWLQNLHHLTPSTNLTTQLWVCSINTNEKVLPCLLVLVIIVYGKGYYA